MLEIKTSDKVNIEKFVDVLKQKKINLKLENENLKFYAPKGIMTSQLIEEIKKNKLEIIDYLKEQNLENDKSILYTPIEPIEKQKYYNLSAQEKRMFVVNRLDNKSTAYNTTLTIRIIGNFDILKFKSIFKTITERHESLRTTFGMIDAEPIKYIHENVDFDVDFIETDEGEDKVEEIIKDFIKPYDLEKLPLFRTKVIKSKKQNVSYLVIDIHHIISDGVSGAIIVDEMNKLYNDCQLDVPKIHYKDYAVWHEKLLSMPFMRKEKNFYMKELSGELPILDLPTDFKRPSVFSSEGESEHLVLQQADTQKIREYIKSKKVTLFTLLFSCFNIMLSKYSGKEDIIVGTPVAGRIHEDIYSMCGIFLNTLPIRSNLNRQKSFSEFLSDTSKKSLRTFDNQDYPFDKLLDDLNIERDSSRNPVFTTMFVMQNMGTADLISKDFTSSRYDLKHKMAQVDITVNATELKGTIDLEFNYCTKLFKKITIKRMLEHFENILNLAISNEEITIDDIDMLSSEEKEKLLIEFNNNQTNYDKLTFHGLFERQAELHPDNVAIYFKDKKITYDELNKKANRLAHNLIKYVIEKDEVIAILCESSINMAVAMLAILKSGGAYLPIKTELPIERIKFMLNDSSIKLSLADSENSNIVDTLTTCINIDDKSSYSEENSNLNLDVRLTDLAYVIYTSGTTGTPKGVMIEHGSISKTMQWRIKKYVITENDCGLELFSYAFDGFIAAFYTFILAGASVVIFEKNAQKDPSKVKDEIINHHVTRLLCVPMLFGALNEAMSKEDFKNIKTITLAADKTPVSLIEDFKKKCPDIKITNEYGPTECSIVSTINMNMKAENISNIGKPADNTKIYIVDKNNKIQPIGVVGELCLSGSRLARGYQNRDELTKQKFIINPYNYNERFYKTGDLARWLDDGTIDFIGRTDFQVKIRGFRVETAEVQTEINKFKKVKENVVIDITDNQGNKYLCAYIVKNGEIILSELRNFLSKSLPDYEIPSRFVFLEKIPLTSNGKINRNALPKPDDNVSYGLQYRAPQSENEKKLEQIWSNLLEIKDIGINNNFFEIGGDSMKIIKLHQKIDAEYKGLLTVTDLFSYPTIYKQAQYIDELTDNNDKTTKHIKKSNKQSDNNDIAIIGLSFKLPKCETIEQFRKIVNTNTNCVCDMPENRKNDAKKIAVSRKGKTGEIKFEKLAYLDKIDEFDPSFFKIAPSEAELMDPNQRLFLECSYSAIEDAGICPEMMKKTRTGVFVGFGGDSEYGSYIAKENPNNYSVAAAGNLVSVIPSRISYFLDLKGPAMVINSACSSSLVAIHEACNSIKSGECDMALAGGVKLWLSCVDNEYSMGIESGDNITRSFDENSNGTGKGEGVGAIFIKPLEKALQDGNSIYAVIKGSAINQDGTSNGITAPNPIAQSNVIEDALSNANVNPEDIGLIEAHGTATKLGDPIEIDGITKAFRKHTQKKQYCAITAIKSNFGHLDNSAGITGVIKMAIALKYKELSPISNFTAPNKAIDFVDSPVYVNAKAKPWNIETGKKRTGMVSSFGLSGTNCSMILEEPPIQKSEETNQDFEIITFSAMSKELLLKSIVAFGEFLNSQATYNLRDICYTLNTGRNKFNFRAAAVIKSDKSNLSEISTLLLDSINKDVKNENCYYNNFEIVPNSISSRANSITQSEQNKLTDESNYLLNNCNSSDKSQNVEFLSKVANLYVSGAESDLGILYCNEKRLRVNLPTYPFERKRCWADIEPNIDEKDETIYHKEIWDEVELPNSNTKFNGTILLIEVIHDEELCKALSESCSSFYNMNYYEELPKESNLCDNDKIVVSIESNEKNFEKIIEALIGIIKTLTIKNLKVNLDIIVNYSCKIRKESEEVNPYNAIFVGLFKSLAIENKKYSIRIIDLDKSTSSKIISKIIISKTINSNIALRNNKLYKEVIRPLNLESCNSNIVNFKDKGVYLITGGTGHLGLKLAELISKQYKINIVLLTRKNISEIDGRIITKFNELNSINCSNIKIINCDITDYENTKYVIEGLRDEFGRVNGIFNCAAVGVGKLTDELSDMNCEDILDILAPKVKGTQNIAELTAVDCPDFMVNYSSTITILGGKNASAYTAANSFLDSYSTLRNNMGYKTLTIDWPYFDNGNNIKSNVNNKLMFQPILEEESFKIINQLIKTDCERVIVGKINRKCDILKLCGKMPFNLCEELKIETVPKKDVAEFKLSGRDDENYTDCERKIAKCFSESLGLENVDIYDDFFEIGGNSLLAIKFETVAEEENLSVGSEELYEYKTVFDISEFLTKGNRKSDNVEKKNIRDSVIKNTNSTTVREIEHIEPFNDVFFESCFYNSFFPVVKHYNYSIAPYLANEVPTYSYENNKLVVNYISAENRITVMNRNGIKIKNNDYCDDNFINDIKTAVSSDMPVILWVDCYYEPIRNDTYKKVHWCHSILIYGFDENSNEFMVIEHLIKDNLSYKKRMISFENIKRMAKGYQENFYKEFKKPCLNIFSKNNYSLISDSRSDYKKNILLNTKSILEGLNSLLVFTAEVNSLIIDKQSFFDNYQKIIESINEIINSKDAEIYKLNTIYGKNADEIISSITILKDKWGAIRRIIAKCGYSNRYDEDKIKSLKNILDELNNKEHEYAKNLISVSNK